MSSTRGYLPTFQLGLGFSFCYKKNAPTRNLEQTQKYLRVPTWMLEKIPGSDQEVGKISGMRKFPVFFGIDFTSRKVPRFFKQFPGRNPELGILLETLIVPEIED